MEELTGGKRTQELAIGGQRYLEETVEAAFQILSSMNDELCNPALWPTSSSTAASSVTTPSSVSSNGVNGDVSSESSHHHVEGGALEEAWFHYRASVAALRAVILAIPNSQVVAGTMGIGSDGSEVEKLEKQASSIQKELAGKKKHVKLLMDEVRDVIADVSTWQSPCSS